MRGESAAGGGVDELLQARETLYVLVQLQSREQIVLVVCQRVDDRALIAVVGREVKGVIEYVADPFENGVVGNRAFEELDAVVARNVLPLGRKEVIDDEDSLGPARQRVPDEVSADKPCAADDEERLAG